MTTLDTGIKFCKNVTNYSFGAGNFSTLTVAVNKRKGTEGYAVFFLDKFFAESKDKLLTNSFEPGKDLILVVDTSTEPTTEMVNQYYAQVLAFSDSLPSVVVGIGGGSTLDSAKAVSNLLGNGGKAEDYQGWDLLPQPGVYKIAVPTLSGTGAEATRTCVMTNKKTGLKLGMNSDFTVYDEIIFDPELTATVPREQYFYTGMDAYIHCIESLGGGYRNAVGDAFSRETLNLCREVFLSDDMMAEDKRSKMMVASYLGGCAIATSYVGVIHPFSAGLSVVLGLPHCLANCIVMRAMQEFYPEEYIEFWQMVEKQGVNIPEGLARELTQEQYQQLFDSTVIHEKPLTNALGDNFREVLTFEKVTSLFKMM